MRDTSALIAVAALLLDAAAGFAPPAGARQPTLLRRVRTLCASEQPPASPDDAPTDDDELQQQLTDIVQMKDFNNELYAHLNKRPEYETSELYSQLRKRQDVDDPLYSELESRREMLSNAPLPNEEQTPGEVIEYGARHRIGVAAVSSRCGGGVAAWRCGGAVRFGCCPPRVP
jgi:Asp-tRNA(Asn)/Glu-tRNA(Gln) amidotransferase C subunit